ncbi:DNA internalization-related competence protein ComEC/Rec2 [Bacillus sp. DJP31]|uniref:DNA internalization-related competence protein ComEC/Rec2 n=1 Tax=Bacillus sp. DJP31 TaxID=3409789 RepID=UPI003BB5C73B
MMNNKWVYIAFSSLLGIMFVSFNLSLILLLFALIVVCFILQRDIKIGIGFIVAFILFGYNFYFHESTNVSKLTEGTSSFTGKIITTPTINGDSLRFNFELASGEKLYFTYKIQTEQEKNGLLRLKSRTICSFEGELKPPQEARNYNSFDFKKYLYWQKVHWMVSPSSFSMSSCKNRRMTLIDHINHQRDTALNSIEQNMPSPLNGFVQALIFGGRGLIEEDVLIAYQELGLIHLLAISGMHVSLICAFVYLGLVRMGLTKEKVMIFMMILLPVYGVLAGGSPSVIRAAIMTFLVLLKIRYRTFPLSTLDLISLAFIVMVFYNPFYVFNVGFQLSFAVTLALIISSQTILLKLTNPILTLIVASTIAQISSLPLLIYHFYQFSLLSTLLNLIYIPLITFIILPICILLFFLLLVDFPFLNIISTEFNTVLNIINQIAVYISDFDWHVLVLGKPPLFITCLYLVAILFTFVCWERRKKFHLFPFVPIILVILLHFAFPYMNPRGEVTIIDVGQGDSILIELPYRRGVYLIDTGGRVEFDVDKWKQKMNSFSIGGDIIIPYLKSKGIRKIDKLILTHPDMDHMGEAPYILGHMKISEILIGEYNEPNEMEEELISLAKEEQVEVKRVKSGDSWSVSGIPFKLVAPFQVFSNKNDGSIVLATILGGESWLFTGDIEVDAEEALIARYPNLQAGILKVAHHGSKTSTTESFLKVTQPKVALISAGYENRFGHPHEEILTRLHQQKVKILRTDQQGAIRFIFSPNRIGTFHTKLP